MENFIISYNAGVGSPAAPVQDPQNDYEHYRYMTGQFRDGTPITIGGNGYNPGSSDFTNYVFHSDPNNTSGWSMTTEGVDVGDPRALGSVKIESYQPGQIFTMDLAHIYTSNPEVNNVESVWDAKEDIIEVQAIYDDNFSETCGIVNTVDISFEHVKVYPNPTNGNFHIAQTGEFDSYILRDNLGKMVSTGSLNTNLTSLEMPITNGIYFLQLENKKTGVSTHKSIIKQ